MNSILKWAIIGAALAVIQFFIFNGMHQENKLDRIASGTVGIVVWAVLGALIGLAIYLFKNKK